MQSLCNLDLVWMKNEVIVYNTAKNCTQKVQSNTVTSVRSSAPSDIGLCHPVKPLACRLSVYPQLTEQSQTSDIHGSVHRGWFSRNTNKMQLCNRIYYSKVYWRFNMFRAAHRSSSGALNFVCSLWFIYPCGDRPLPRLSGKWITMDPFPTQPWQRLVTTWVHKPEAANIV